MCSTVLKEWLAQCLDFPRYLISSSDNSCDRVCSTVSKKRLAQCLDFRKYLISSSDNSLPSPSEEKVTTFDEPSPGPGPVPWAWLLLLVVVLVGSLVRDSLFSRLLRSFRFASRSSKDMVADISWGIGQG